MQHTCHDARLPWLRWQPENEISLLSLYGSPDERFSQSSRRLVAVGRQWTSQDSQDLRGEYNLHTRLWAPRSQFVSQICLSRTNIRHSTVGMNDLLITRGPDTDLVGHAVICCGGLKTVTHNTLCPSRCFSVLSCLLRWAYQPCVQPHLRSSGHGWLAYTLPWAR